MPRYDFICDKCENEFTVERRMSEGAGSPVCPKCKSKATRQVLPAFYAKTIKKS